MSVYGTGSSYPINVGVMAGTLHSTTIIFQSARILPRSTLITRKFEYPHSKAGKRYIELL